jgi:hypothetical protein
VANFLFFETETNPFCSYHGSHEALRLSVAVEVAGLGDNVRGFFEVYFAAGGGGGFARRSFDGTVGEEEPSDLSSTSVYLERNSVD